MTKVVNINKLKTPWKIDSDYVYIGRNGKGLYSIFGNPFHLDKEGDRLKIIEQYRVYLEKRVEEDPDFRKKVKELKGKTLVCFCKPRACHGDVLAEFAEKL